MHTISIVCIAFLDGFQIEMMYVITFYAPSATFKVQFASSLPTKVDLRNYHSISIYDQGNLGSCTANAACFAYKYIEYRGCLI